MLAGLAFVVLGQAKIDKPAPPVYADATTRKVVESCRKAFAGLKSAKLRIQADGETKRYSYSAKRIAAYQHGAQWTFDNRLFTLSTGKGLYRGHISPYSVNGWLSKVGAAPERVPILLIAGQNPLDILVAPGSRVRKVGVMTVNGALSDLVEVKTTGLRVSMAIRRDNHLFASLSAENVDPQSHVLLRSMRTLTWSSINAPVSSNTFKMGRGKKPLGLDRIK